MRGIEEMIQFQCDYEEGACPQIQERLVETNLEQTVGQGEPCRGGNDAILDEGVLAPLGPDDPKPNGGYPGIDA